MESADPHPPRFLSEPSLVLMGEEDGEMSTSMYLDWASAVSSSGMVPDSLVLERPWRFAADDLRGDRKSRIERLVRFTVSLAGSLG